MNRALLSFLFLSIFLTGCMAESKETPEQVKLTVAAAASVSKPFNELAPLFEQETGIALTYSYGSTGQLADQLQHGAPFDVFAAADHESITALIEQGHLLQDSTTTYAVGRIGIATRIDQELEVRELEDLLQNNIKKIAIANPEHAPYGLAAKQALETANLYDEVEAKLVFGRNIADTQSFLETGNVEAAITSISLVDEQKLRFHLIDEQAHKPIQQTIAISSRTDSQEAAELFIDFLTGPIGQDVLEKHGFDVGEEE